MWEDPTEDPSGISLTPFHLIVFASGALSLAAGNLHLPLDMIVVVGMWRRLNALLVMLLFAHFCLMGAVRKYHEQITTTGRFGTIDKGDIAYKRKVPLKPTDWDHESSHPSHFLTTRDAKPRLFPFPLGKAGGQATKGELWWEAGNAAHVGHFNPKEDPAEKEKLRLDMLAREKARHKKAADAVKQYEDSRGKWHSRLTDVKTIGAIVAISMFHRTLGTICLVAFLYYVFATQLFKVFNPEEPEEEFIPWKRKPYSLTPGMALTYIYEPDGNGSVQATGQMPTKAPSHRLTTSLDNRYAS